MSPMLYVLVFLATVLAVEGVVSIVRENRSGQTTRARRRLRALAGSLQAGGERETSLLRAAQQGRVQLGSLLLNLLPNRKRIELLLYRAGAPMTASRFLALSGVLAMVGWFAAGAVSNDLLAGLPGLGLGLAPWIVVRAQASKRMRVFEEQFPDSLELLTRALRAGHSLGTGFHLVGEEMQDPIGNEFAQVAEEIKFGLDIRTALLNLSHRIENPDLPYFVTAVLIQRETGGNLAELLDNLGGLVRERAKFHGKLRAITAQGRMTAAILALWPAITVALLVWTHPSYIEPLLYTDTGHTALAVSLVLCAVGYGIARRLADVRV